MLKETRRDKMLVYSFIAISNIIAFHGIGFCFWVSDLQSTMQKTAP